MRDAALQIAAWIGHTKNCKILPKHNADVHTDDGFALRTSALHHHTKIFKMLLENNACIHDNNDEILKGFQINVQEIFKTNIADVALQYCDIDDYKYFPSWYIKTKIVPTKNARNI